MDVIGTIGVAGKDRRKQEILSTKYETNLKRAQTARFEALKFAAWNLFRASSFVLRVSSPALAGQLPFQLLGKLAHFGGIITRHQQ